MKILAFLLSLIIALLTGCESPYDSYPRDNLLIDNFNTKKEIFLKLESDLQNHQLITSLGISRAYVGSALYAEYEVWKWDLMGVGGCSKGYVYSQRLISPLVESIDATTTPCGPEQGNWIRRIEGKWYLYYRASN